MSTVVLDNSNTVVTESEVTGYVQVVVPETAVVWGDSTAYVSQEKIETVVVQSESNTVVAAGWQGPPGPAIPAGPGGPEGTSEENKVYAKRIDFINDAELYRGEAPVGSLESASIWRIRKITIAADSDVTETWAEGSAEFNKIWQDRLSYQYI